MPSSKKPRKKMNRQFLKRRAIPTTRQYLDYAKDKFQAVSLVVALKLHTGTCDQEDLFAMQNVLCLTSASLALRAETFDEEFFASAGKAISIDGIDAWTSLYERCKDSGRFVCTSRELNNLRTAFFYADAIIEQSMKDCPLTLMREYCAITDIMHLHHIGKAEISLEMLKKAVSSSCIDMNQAQFLAKKYGAKIVVGKEF